MPNRSRSDPTASGLAASGPNSWAVPVVPHKTAANRISQMPRIGGSYNSVGRDRFPLAEPLGDTLVAVYDWAYWLGPMTFFCISALILYTVLYQARLVPVWLLIWGIVGGVLLLVRAVLEMYGVEFSAALQAVFAAPIGINETVLAIWLIVKGFNAAPGIASIPAPDTPAT